MGGGRHSNNTRDAARGNKRGLGKGFESSDDQGYSKDIHVCVRNRYVGNIKRDGNATITLAPGLESYSRHGDIDVFGA